MACIFATVKSYEMTFFDDTFKIALLNLAYALLVVDEYSAREGLNATNSSEFSLRNSRVRFRKFRDKPRKF